MSGRQKASVHFPLPLASNDRYLLVRGSVTLLRVSVVRSGFFIALFWFVFFGALGIFFPYYTLYLKENADLTGTELGMVLSVMPLVGILAQPFWGNIADRTGARSRLIAFLAIGTALGFGVLGLAEGFMPILCATALLAAFSTPVIPLSVSVTLAVFRNSGPHAYGFARVWGTVGFLISVLIFPRGLTAFQQWRELIPLPGGPSEPGLGVMFSATALLVLIAAFIAFALPTGGVVAARAPRGDWRRLFQNRPMKRLLLFSFGAYLFIQGPMGLLPVYVRSFGGTLETIQQMWILMLIVEIPLIMSSGMGLKRIGARGLLAAGVLAGGVRWTVCGLTSNLTWIYPVQMLHGVMVTGLMMGGPLYVDAIAPDRLRSTAQALVAVVGLGFGGIASNTIAGWILQHLGPSAPYLIGGAGALAMGLSIQGILPRVKREGESEGMGEGETR